MLTGLSSVWASKRPSTDSSSDTTKRCSKRTHLTLFVNGQKVTDQPTYGVFEGHTPILVTSDPDLIQEVFIKQFSNFVARKVRTDSQVYYEVLFY